MHLLFFETGGENSQAYQSHALVEGPETLSLLKPRMNYNIRNICQTWNGMTQNPVPMSEGFFAQKLPVRHHGQQCAIMDNSKQAAMKHGPHTAKMLKKSWMEDSIRPMASLARAALYTQADMLSARLASIDDTEVTASRPVLWCHGLKPAHLCCVSYAHLTSVGTPHDSSTQHHGLHSH